LLIVETETAAAAAVSLQLRQSRDFSHHV